VVNVGGIGRFRLLTPEDYPEPHQSQDHLAIIDLPPFKITPTEFQLRRKEGITLQLIYLPTEVGEHSTRVLLLADDCSLRSIVIKASSTTIKLSVSELEGMVVDYDALSQPDYNYLDFGAIPLGSTKTKSIVIRNKSSVAINYDWQWRGGDGRGGDDDKKEESYHLYHQHQHLKREYPHPHHLSPSVLIVVD